MSTLASQSTGTESQSKRVTLNGRSDCSVKVTLFRKRSCWLCLTEQDALHAPSLRRRLFVRCFAAKAQRKVVTLCPAVTACSNLRSEMLEASMSALRLVEAGRQVF